MAMIATGTVLMILSIHWIADFLLQNKWMAENKSHSNKALLTHTSVYTAITVMMWLLFRLIPLLPKYILLLLCLTFVLHTITDFITSRINARWWRNGKSRLFFNMVGFDQLLHYLQLFGTYYICWYGIV